MCPKKEEEEKESTLPLSSFLLFLVELLDHFPHFGAQLRIGRLQFFLVFFQLLILLF